MGVHNLWSIVEPVRESVPLYSLSGKTLAVDLSLWVCEAQHVQAMMGRVTKPHLRNLFFRVSSLTLMGVKLVFVMEGEAPKLKYETMIKRTEGRYGGFKKPSSSTSANTTSRGRFNAVLRECAEMLDYLGVPWVTAAGEAEAMCAYLDSQGLVDGCITNDGDAFLYGAQTVYRNFNMSSKDPQVDCYQASRLQTELHLTRENLVGLAILLGCDYIPKGIPGIGREQALKLIQTVKGQSLLQRFIQWREDNINVFDGVVKKVPHCNVCRHPGSVKAHERGGCVLCNSQQFCQPQDFDYQCPCDWHHHENTRQALSLEANIRRKTLASQQFPFTEIINEFLISKDTVVSHFKRRKPNMLLMQKFAFDKMEWPKHYTSEKVLVLMTYAEMMNRKNGRDVPSQIQPIRILKPRVRNAVACFEVLWRTPEHYVFPEDRAAEDQHEVRTVEEESLFQVAFPEMVSSYMSSKALAEEDKRKKKKPRSKKEKPSDVGDGVSDLLAQMTLQSSSSANATTQPQTLLAPTLNTQKTEVLLLDTPVSQKQLRVEKDDRCSSSNPLSRAKSEAAASPSVSSVIDALHLSDINWEALSFTSSPASQANHIVEPGQKKSPVIDETWGENTERESSNDDSRSSSKLCYTECCLRDRVLMRDSTKATSRMQENNGVYSNHPNYESASPERGRFIEQSSSKGSNKRNVSGNESAYKEDETLSEDQRIPAQTKMEKSDVSEKPPQKYTFVRTALSSFVPSQKSQSDPGQRDKTSTSVPQKSVCISVCSSSEDSDGENQHPGPRRLTKMNMVKKNAISKFPLRPISVPKITKPHADTAHKPQTMGSKCKSVPENSRPLTKNEYKDVRTAKVDEVAAQTPASPVTILDSEDSVICSDSPLPLAERLRLKFLK